MTNFLFFVLLALTCLVSASTGQSYVAEVYFVAEPQAIRNYIKLGYSAADAEKTMRSDHDFMVYQINHYFQTMKPHGLDMQVRSKRFDILTNELFNKSLIVKGRQVGDGIALMTFEDYLNNLGTEDYDLAILWTGYDLINIEDGNDSPVGFAPVDAACNGYASSAVVEYTMDQGSASTAAHEIAHVLGSDHDGEPGVSARCNGSDGYVMSGGGGAESKYRWWFSSCSAQQILNATITQNRTCLSETTTPASTWTMSDLINSPLLDLTNICKRSFLYYNGTQYLCQHPSNYDYKELKGDVACKYLYCGATGAQECRPTSPTEGIVCDVGKRCSQGKCVAAPADFPAPIGLRSNCLYGDRIAGYIDKKAQTCGQYLDSEGLYNCYSAKTYKDCCDTCEKKKKKEADCPYGDQIRSCSKNLCSNDANRAVCCETCKGVSKQERRTVLTNIMWEE